MKASSPNATTAMRSCGRPDTNSATRRIQPNPCPITAQPIQPRPSGVSSSASTAAGITTAPITGTASRFAKSP